MDTEEEKVKKRSREEREASSNKVLRTSGESRGAISREMAMDVDEVGWTDIKDVLLEERTPIVKWMDGDRKKGIQACKIQQ